MTKLRVILCLTLLVVVALTFSLRAVEPSDAPSILSPKDVPGFFLHSSFVLHSTTATPFGVYDEYRETWSTMTKRDWSAYSRRGGKAPRQMLFVQRYVFSTSKQAKLFVESTWTSPKLEGGPELWLANSPTGKNIGNQCWHRQYIPQSHYQADLKLQAYVNKESLRMLVIVNRTVFCFTAEGTADRPVNRSWAERLVQTTANQVRRIHGRDKDDRDDDED